MKPVLTIDHVSIDYEVDPPVHAVDDVSLTLHQGEILGIAGESGCGKTTLAYGITRLLRPPARIVSGAITFHGTDSKLRVDDLADRALRSFRWDQISMVFQGAMNALNPVITIRAQFEDIFTTHRPDMSRAERTTRIGELLDRVGVGADRMNVYPHQLSGGMRQRVIIAMALALNPPIMIMDEPTTALDVVVQREILQEIMRLREDFGFAVIFITHDLPLLLEITDRIAIMRRGRIVEFGPTEEIYFSPQDDYTRQLLGSFPSLTGDRGSFVRGAGTVAALGEQGDGR